MVEVNDYGQDQVEFHLDWEDSCVAHAASKISRLIRNQVVRKKKRCPPVLFASIKVRANFVPGGAIIQEKYEGLHDEENKCKCWPEPNDPEHI